MLEICVDSLRSVQAAIRGGADRLELCANLPEGGTTPSAGLIKATRARFNGILMVMIRPRGYDFLYSSDEIGLMHQEIAMAKTLGADGVVFGCLKADGQVDQEVCRSLFASAASMDVTFHRAFDLSRDLEESLETIAGLGIKRILTSGGQPDVPAGLEIIGSLVEQAAGRLSIMPGGGVTEANLETIVRQSGVKEIHLSARSSVPSGMTFRRQHCGMGSYSGTDEYAWRETDERKVRLARQALDFALRNRENTAGRKK